MLHLNKLNANFKEVAFEQRFESSERVGHLKTEGATVQGPQCGHELNLFEKWKEGQCDWKVSEWQEVKPESGKGQIIQDLWVLVSLHFIVYMNGRCWIFWS